MTQYKETKCFKTNNIEIFLNFLQKKKKITLINIYKKIVNNIIFNQSL